MAFWGLRIDTGLTRDDQELHDDRIKLWTELNTCWLALCQKQKDMTLVAMRQSGPRPDNILTEDILNNMGKELVRLCDKMEQYGLVDYQMGVWEGDILGGEQMHCARAGFYCRVSVEEAPPANQLNDLQPYASASTY